MASKLQSALGSIGTPQVARLRGANTNAGYRAAAINPAPQKSSLVDTLGQLVQVGADAYQKWDDRNKSKADERSNEIISKLSPEQRREAIANGTLLYQDDPYAMTSLKVKTGRNAAYLIDDDVMQKVRNGEFRSREEMEQYRHSKLQEGAEEYAKQFGIDHNDADFQRGYNADITQRNISLYGAHDSFLSNQAQKGAVVSSRVELNGVLSDPALLKRQDSADFFSNYMTQGLVTGSIPSDAQAQQLIGASLSDVSNRPGGAHFLMNLKDKKVTLNGAESTYGELMGEDSWNALMVTAQKSQFDNDAKLTESYSLKLSSALNQEDPRLGWEMLQGAKADLDSLQPGEEVTPQRQQMIQAQEALQNKMRAWTAAQQKAMDDAKKVSNKQQVIDGQFQKRIDGQYVSTSYKDMPTNENTGEFKHSDMVNFANQKLSQIDQMDITDEQKDRLKLSYLRADSKDGAFRTAIGTMVTDANQEWSSAVINGKMPESTPALDSLRRIRNADPQLIAGLYPEQAELFLTMDMMDKQGIDSQILLDADKQQATRSKDQRFEDDKAFESALNSTKAPEISRMPASLRDSARKIYDAVKYRSGNPNLAMTQMQKFMQDSTYAFSDESADGGTIGVIPKNALQVNDDPASWTQGRDILEAARKGIITSNPWITNKQLTMYQQGDSIYMMDTTGTVRIRYDKEILTREWQRSQQMVDDKARKEAIEKANKRAPIAAVNQAASEIKQGKRKGLAQRSQEFRESRLNNRNK